MKDNLEVLKVENIKKATELKIYKSDVVTPKYMKDIIEQVEREDFASSLSLEFDLKMAKILFLVHLRKGSLKKDENGEPIELDEIDFSDTALKTASQLLKAQTNIKLEYLNSVKEQSVSKDLFLEVMEAIKAAIRSNVSEHQVQPLIAAITEAAANTLKIRG